MYPEAPGAFNGRPDPSIAHPGGGWSQNQVKFEGQLNQSNWSLWVNSFLAPSLVQVGAVSQIAGSFTGEHPSKPRPGAVFRGEHVLRGVFFRGTRIRGGSLLVSLQHRPKADLS